jgi:hypothetical protein
VVIVTENEINETARLRNIVRTRRELSAAEQDFRQEMASHQELIKSLVTRLSDASDESVEEELRRGRARLKELSDKHERSASELVAFERSNPSASEHARQQRIAELAEGRKQQKPIRDRFRTNVRRRFRCLQELRELEIEATELYRMAESRWRHSEPGLAPDAPGIPAVAGIHGSLTTFMPRGFFSWNDMPTAAGGRIHEIEAAIRRWDPTLFEKED